MKVEAARPAKAGLDVRIERLAPMRVAYVRAVSRTPEQDAWSRLRAWADGAGFLHDPGGHPVFGFNNPPPTRDSAEYGYEIWVGIDPECVPPTGIGVKDFPGGRYAVTSCALRGSVGVPEAWKALLRWVHASPYKWRRTTHELERMANPDSAEDEVVPDLYLPLED